MKLHPRCWITLVLAFAAPAGVAAGERGPACLPDEASRAFPCLCQVILHGRGEGGDTLRLAGAPRPFFTSPTPIGHARMTSAGLVIVRTERPAPTSDPDAHPRCSLVLVDSSGGKVVYSRPDITCVTPDLAPDGHRLVFIDRRGVQLVDVARPRPAPRLLLRSRPTARRASDIAEPVSAMWRDDERLVVLVRGEAGYVWAWHATARGKVLRGGPSTVSLHRPVRGAYALADFPDHGPGHLTVVGADDAQRSFTEYPPRKEGGDPREGPWSLRRSYSYRDARLSPDLGRLLFEQDGRYYVRRLDAASAQERPWPLSAGIPERQVHYRAWLDATHLALVMGEAGAGDEGQAAALWIIDVAAVEAAPRVDPPGAVPIQHEFALPAGAADAWLPESPSCK